jgi:hypothetical protein
MERMISTGSDDPTDSDTEDETVEVVDEQISDAADDNPGDSDDQADVSSRAETEDSDASDGPSQELVDTAKSLGLDVDGLDADTLDSQINTAMRVLANAGKREDQDEPETTPDAENTEAPAPTDSPVEAFAFSPEDEDLLRDRLDDDGYSAISKLVDRLNASEAKLATLTQEHGGMVEANEAQNQAAAEQEAERVVNWFHGELDSLGMEDLFGKVGEITKDSDAAKHRQTVWTVAQDLKRSLDSRGVVISDSELLKRAAQAALPTVAERLRSRDIKKKTRPGNPRGRSSSKANGKAAGGDIYDRVLAAAGVSESDDDY